MTITTTHHLADLLLAEDHPNFIVSVGKADDKGLELKLMLGPKLGPAHRNRLF